MKKFLLAFVVILIILMACAGAFFLTVYKFNDRQPMQIGTVLKESGVVAYKQAQDYVVVDQAEMNFASGTYIKTGDASAAQILFPFNDVLSIAENSEVQINFNPTSITVVQLSGSSWNRASGDVDYQLETATTLTKIEAGKFGVDLVAGQSPQVYVVEGNAQVGVIGLDHNFVDAPKIIEPLKMAVVSKNPFEIAVSDTPQLLQARDWYQQNLATDILFNKEGQTGVRTLVQARINDSRNQVAGANTNIDTSSSLLKAINEIKNRYARVDEALCSNIDKTDVVNADLQNIENLGKSHPELNDNFDLLSSLINTAKVDCADHLLSPQEIDQLNQIIKKLDTLH